jgi:serine phosphatase RsbU (regulator of sigma subunit)
MNDNSNNEGIEILIPAEEVVRRYRLIQNDVEGVHVKERIGIKSMLEKFGTAGMDIGIGYKRAYGSVMSGDSFQLFMFPDNSFLFIFSDVSGHGLGAYTTYIKLRSAAILAVRKESARMTSENGTVEYKTVIHDIIDTFTNIMEDSVSRDFSSVIFTFVGKNPDGSFTFRFFNRGMHYPFLITDENCKIPVCKNLNDNFETWQPARNSPLGSDFRALLDEKYYDCSESSIVLHGSGRLCFFTDGIVEAANEDAPPEEFGFDRLSHILCSTYNYFPQAAVNMVYREVYDFIGHPIRQFDDMTAVLIDVPHDTSCHEISDV